MFYRFTQFDSCVIDLEKGAAISLNDINHPICWEEIFENDNPVEVEVGCGRGRFLLEAAKQRPEVNYLGVERAPKYVRRTQERFQKHIKHAATLFGDSEFLSFSNVRLAWSDAAYFVDRYVSDNSVQAYHVYFPDPWPKKRQHKRRLFRSEIWLRGLVRTLHPSGGCLHVATDFGEYFHEIRHRLSQSTTLVEKPSDSVERVHIRTNFEMKYLAQGRKIYRGLYERCDTSNGIMKANNRL